MYFLKSERILLFLNIRNAAYFSCFKSLHVVSHHWFCASGLCVFEGLDMHLAADVYTFVTNVIATSMLLFICREYLALKMSTVLEKALKSFLLVFHSSAKDSNYFVPKNDQVYLQYGYMDFVGRMET